VFSTATSLQVRARTNSSFTPASNCYNAAFNLVYRLVNYGPNSSQVISAGDNLYTNSSGSSPLSSGHYGIAINTGGNATRVATVSSSGGLVTAVHVCTGGGGGPGGGRGGGGGSDPGGPGGDP
tara:strand:- start:590 stop:958 length:369 start_codon:yes stop_codon:yes gene_type:complete